MYKVGDKVRVRKDLEVDKRYGGCMFVNGMEDKKSKVVTIKAHCGGDYLLKEDIFRWTDEMLEPVDSIEKFWKEFESEKVAIHCDTEEKANKFLAMCHERGLTWISGDSLIAYKCWRAYGKMTCYNYEIGNRILHGYKCWYESNGYKVITCDDIFNKTPVAKKIEPPSFTKQTISVFYDAKGTTVIIEEGGHKYTGRAKWNGTDIYDRDIGYMYAWMRARDAQERSKL